MKKYVLLLFITMLLTNVSYADCPTDNVYLTSQAQIDAFTTYYVGCSTIDFDVTIKEDVDGDITNLNGLSDIQTINGNFYITENSALTDLGGMYNLQTVSGDFYIFENSGLQHIELSGLSSIQGSYFYIGHNDNLVDLSGLTALSNVTNHLYIGHNDNLQNLNGLNNLNTVNGGLTIEYNDNLQNLNGLSNLQTIGDNLLIGDNNELASFSSLSSVTSVGGFLWIGPNPSLSSFNGLESLNSIGKGIWIGRNTGLTNISALSGITSLNGYLMIDDNDALQSLYGLHNITFIDSLLWIGNNNSLTDISLDNLNTIDGHLLINNNALVNLDGLTNLTSINGYLHIIGNYDLNNIEGIEQINHTTITNLSIYNNEELSACAVESVCNYLDLASPNTDIHDNLAGCNNDSEVEAQCSCDITATATTAVCDNNGTATDSSDDTYTFSVTVTGSNTASGWTASNGTTGNYGVSVSFGPFAISGGDQNITITDNDDSGCTTLINVEAPMTCSMSSSCTLVVNSVETLECDNNGTANDKEDDKFSIVINISREESGESYMVRTEAGDYGPYNYGVDQTISGFSANGNEINIEVYDMITNSCTESFIVSQNSCSIFSGKIDMLLTPNGDGETETLIFKDISLDLASDYPDNRLYVYNRYGNVVYKTENYNNDWDGSYNGGTLPDGTYYYVLQLGEKEGKIITGYILIIK